MIGCSRFCEIGGHLGQNSFMHVYTDVPLCVCACIYIYTNNHTWCTPWFTLCHMAKCHLAVYKFKNFKKKDNFQSLFYNTAKVNNDINLGMYNGKIPIQICRCVNVYIMYICMCIFSYMYVWMCARACVCIYLYTRRKRLYLCMKVYKYTKKM